MSGGYVRRYSISADGDDFIMYTDIPPDPQSTTILLTSSTHTPKFTDLTLTWTPVYTIPVIEPIHRGTPLVVKNLILDGHDLMEMLTKLCVDNALTNPWTPSRPNQPETPPENPSPAEPPIPDQPPESE
jgi:hypothetical protein